MATTVTQKGQVTIPIKVREFLGIKPKDKVIFEIKKDNRVIVKKIPDLKDLLGYFKTNIRASDVDYKKAIEKQRRQKYEYLIKGK
jgi:AbrB family looped-hinge helix DNA binding protein